MNAICVLVSLFFLIWTFFVATLNHALIRLGETLFLGVLKKYSTRFFYYPFHHKVFKNRSVELLVFSSAISENVARFGYLVTAIYCLISLHLGFSFILILFFILLFLLILVIGDFIPRLWAFRAPEKALAFAFPYASFFLYLSIPFDFVFLKIVENMRRGVGKEKEVDPFEEMKETVVQILQNANVKGKLDATDKKLMGSVLRFKDRIVREVMVPRVDLFSLQDTTTVSEAANVLVKEGYSRTPVYHETIDNIIGVLMFKDILQLYMDCETGKKDRSLLNAPIETIIKSVFYTPETKKLSHLLQEFRTRQMHMAIVVDEYGGTEGVVTIEDILEEIVGDIADEYDDIDEELLYVTQPGGQSWIVDPRMSILDAEETFGIHIPQEGDYDTIGGYIFHKLGSIPPKGLRIHHENFDLEVLSSTDRSIEKIRITSRKNSK